MHNNEIAKLVDLLCEAVTAPKVSNPNDKPKRSGIRIEKTDKDYKVVSITVNPKTKAVRKEVLRTFPKSVKGSYERAAEYAKQKREQKVVKKKK